MADYCCDSRYVIERPVEWTVDTVQVRQTQDGRKADVCCLSPHCMYRPHDTPAGWNGDGSYCCNACMRGLRVHDKGQRRRGRCQRRRAAGDGPATSDRQVIKLQLCPCGTPVCPACQVSLHSNEEFLIDNDDSSIENDDSSTEK